MAGHDPTFLILQITAALVEKEAEGGKEQKELEMGKQQEEEYNRLKAEVRRC